jgi:hypothetical protein
MCGASQSCYPFGEDISDLVLAGDYESAIFIRIFDWFDRAHVIDATSLKYCLITGIFKFTVELNFIANFQRSTRKLSGATWTRVPQPEE